MMSSKAAKIIGCCHSHVLTLIQTGKLRAKRVKDPWGGYHYDVSLTEATRYACKPQSRGWPRGKPRK